MSRDQKPRPVRIVAGADPKRRKGDGPSTVIDQAKPGKMAMLIPAILFLLASAGGGAAAVWLLR